MAGKAKAERPPRFSPVKKPEAASTVATVLVTAVVTAIGTAAVEGWLPGLTRSVWSWATRETVLVVTVRDKDTLAPVEGATVSVSSITSDEIIDQGTTNDRGMVRLRRDIQPQKVHVTATFQRGWEQLDYMKGHDVTELPFLIDLQVDDLDWRRTTLSHLPPADPLGPPSPTRWTRDGMQVSLEKGNKYFATFQGGPPFYVGSRVPYLDGFGLVNAKRTSLATYQPASYADAHSYWAYYVYPTVVAEGGTFTQLNTYDRAGFTFGLVQMSAHVPNGDFVQLLRRLLTLDSAAKYLPDLTVAGDRIQLVTPTGAVPLESDASSAALVTYLNPDLRKIDEVEVLSSAKFVHWAQSDPQHQRAQVDILVDRWKRNLKQYGIRYALDGKSDKICVLIADIRWQGRGQSAQIMAALSSQDPYQALLGIGENLYPYRTKLVAETIERLEQEGKLGRRVYHLESNEFVPAT